MATKSTAKTKAAPAHEAPAPKTAKPAAAPKAGKAEDQKAGKAEDQKAEANADAPKKSIGKPVTPSKNLADVIGTEDALPRTEVVKKVWEYIRKHDLQDQKDKRTINADAKLKAIFGKGSATMFELNKLLSAHLS